MIGTPIETTATVNEIIEQHPAAVTVFNSFGVDACCGGDRTLARAAADDGVDLEALVAALVAEVTATEYAR